VSQETLGDVKRGPLMSMRPMYASLTQHSNVLGSVPKTPALAPCCLQHCTVFITDHDEKYIYYI